MPRRLPVREKSPVSDSKPPARERGDKPEKSQGEKGHATGQVGEAQTGSASRPTSQHDSTARDVFPGFVDETPKLDPTSVRAYFHRVWALARKEVKTLWNDRFAMVLLVLLPVALLFVVNRSEGGGAAARLGQGGGRRIQQPVVGLCDRDNSTGYPGVDLSAEMVALFFEYETLDQCEVHYSTNQSEMDELLGTGELNAYIIVPDGFEFNLSIRFMAVLEVYLDTLNNVILQDAESLIDEIIDVYSTRMNFTGAIHQVTTVENVPETALRLFQVMPFFFPIVVFSMTLLVNSQALVGDVPKDRVTLSPAKKDEIVLGKLVGAQIVNTLMVLVLWGLSLLFGLQIRGSLAGYFIILWLVALVGTATGLTLSSIANTSLAAFQLFIMVFLLELTLMFFIEDPQVLQWFAVYAGKVCLEKIVLRGQSFGSVATLVEIMLFEVFLFTLIAWICYRMRRSLL